MSPGTKHIMFSNPIVLLAGRMRIRTTREACNVEHMHLEEVSFSVGEGYGHLDVK